MPADPDPPDQTSPAGAGRTVSLDDAALAFLTERHLATLTTLRRDGSPHVVAVGFTWDPATGLARVITRRHSVKVANAARGGRAAVCQVDGPRWLSMEGPVEVTDDPERVAEAVRLYSGRYRTPGADVDRVALEIRVERVLGRW
jgi:PPOX class probable F420-dependent enzyme